MAFIVHALWLIPVLPALAGGIGALLRQSQRRLSAGLAIGSMGISLALALCAFAQSLADPSRRIVNFRWMQFGSDWISLGWSLDPLTAVMLVMIAFVGTADLHLQHRLHGARYELHALLLFPLALCGSDVRRRHRQQPAAALHVLGSRRAHLVSAHRLLVSPSRSMLRRPRKPSSPRESATSACCSVWSGCTRRPEPCSSTTMVQAASSTARSLLCSAPLRSAECPSSRRSRCSSSAEPSGNPASCRYTSGYPTPWKAQRL